MSDRIVCKPTSWFQLRAAAMLLMFAVFSVLFFVDGKWGYREKNHSFYVSEAFEKALSEFREKGSAMPPEEWKDYASQQTVSLPEDTSVLPVGVTVPMPWPDVLQDHAAMKEALGESPEAFYKKSRPDEIRKNPPEQAFTARKIAEQWVVFWICLVLTAATLYILLRTLRRNMAIDGEAFYPATGGRVPFADLVRLDLRKWDTKGLAFAWASTPGGEERKLRIDGLTYGGFKKDQGEPAESLMRQLREHFTGELIEYVTETEEPAVPAEQES